MSPWIRFVLIGLLILGLAWSPFRSQSVGDNVPRVVIFDPDALWNLTDVGKQYNSDLTEARDRLLAQIDKKAQELENVKDKLRQQQASLSEEKIQLVQKDIFARRTELERMNEDATKEMKFQMGDRQGRFHGLMVQAIGEYGKEKRFDLILSKDVAYYSAPNADITQDLVAKFNSMHRPAAAGNPATKKPAEKPKEKAPGGR